MATYQERKAKKEAAYEARVKELAELLRVSPANVPEGKKLADTVKARLYGIGVRETCGRCGGSGSYSFNPIDGTRCFGCWGRRELSADLSKASTLERAKAAVAAGELDRYLQLRKAVSEASAAIRPLMKDIRAVLEPIFQKYESEYKRTRATDERLVGTSIFILNERAGNLWWGKTFRDGVTGVESLIKDRKIDPDFGLLWAVEILKGTMEEAKAIRAEFDALG